jgi:hypothetical protein
LCSSNARYSFEKRMIPAARRYRMPKARTTTLILVASAPAAASADGHSAKKSNITVSTCTRLVRFKRIADRNNRQGSLPKSSSNKPNGDETFPLPDIDRVEWAKEASKGSNVPGVHLIRDRRELFRRPVSPGESPT